VSYSRPGRKNRYFQARTPTGSVQLSAGTPSRSLADRIEGMWRTLAVEHRAWDVLEGVLQRRYRVGELYDLYCAVRGSLDQLRAALRDRDVALLVDAWLDDYKILVAPDSHQHAAAHVRWLLPAGTPLRASELTPAWLQHRLAAYPGKRNTLRKVHSSWSSFCAWLVTRRVLDRNPLEAVVRPPLERPPIAFHEPPAVERLIAAQPTEERRVLFALLYGTGIEVSAALRLTVGDVQVATRSVRAAGTKTHTRDRVCRVANAAWKRLERWIRDKPAEVLLFPSRPTRWTVSGWHRDTAAALKLPPYPLHNARHHWAVMRLRLGAPVAMVQHQLGHSTPMLTLSLYGRFLPSAADQDLWEQRLDATR
jgi:site-specific recombinase XerD